MVKCIVPCCTNDDEISNSNVLFFKTPRNTRIKTAWTKLINNNNSCICSDHFKKQTMVKRNNSVRLTKNAIPTEMLGLKVNPSGSLAAMKHVILAEPKSNNLTRGTSNNRCRACLEDNSSVLQSLFDYLEEEIIADVLSFCTGVEISQEDSMPQFICGNCLFLLKSANVLKKKILISNDYILNERKIQIKLEDNKVASNVEFKQIHAIERTCDHCGLKTTSKYQLINHMQLAHSLKTRMKRKTRKSAEKLAQKPKRFGVTSSSEFSCEICPNTFFINQFYLNAHLRKHKKNKDPPLQECPHCFHKFYTMRKMINHPCSHWTKCYLCDVKMQAYSVSRHIRVSHKDFDLKCKICSEILKNPKRLNYHVKLHFEPSDFICKVCSKGFDERIYLDRHMHRHFDKKYQCDDCGRKIMNKGNLLKHIRLNHLTFKIMFKCPDCPNSYSDKSVLLGHRIMLHGARANFTCNFCHYGFVYKCQLRDHHRKKHSEPDENLIRKPAKTIDPKYINKDCEFKFQCHCGASFKYRHSFLDHMMMHKVKETGVKEFACDLCNVRFTIKCNLDRHNKAVHLKIKPFACLEKGCPKKFSTRAGLKVHQNFHNGNKPYICKFCETKYSDPSTLHKHLKVVHNEDKPYVKRL